MKFDVFFSICQTEVKGYLPNEKTMWQNFFDQVKLADELGYETAWVAETHLSCEIQKKGPEPVIPHFKGEIGLNTDILQLAHKVFAQTEQIKVGSAIRNIICNGGPMAHAEAIKTFLSLHGLNPSENRKLEIGFASGRFQFSNTPYGFQPRNQWEQIAWPVIKGKAFRQATELFLRLLKGDKLSSNELVPMLIKESDFRTNEHWQKTIEAYGKPAEEILVNNFWNFPISGVIPQEAPMNLLNLTIGSHDPETQILANKILPCGVFNLSITPGNEIEATHQRLKEHYHPDGGIWKREYMPRTVLVFINNEANLTDSVRREKATKEAQEALSTYWKAMQGTLDQKIVDKAVENALIGTPDDIIQKLKTEFNPEDRLMLWFDFNNHDNQAVKEAMINFKEYVIPAL